jgi:hypothetical protein
MVASVERRPMQTKTARGLRLEGADIRKQEWGLGPEARTDGSDKNRNGA